MDEPNAHEKPLGGARVRVPNHVVYRSFGEETVILNLETGMYHGLNATAGAMVAALDANDTVAAAIDRLAGEFGEPRDVIEKDVLELCAALVERGLIDRHAGSGT